MILNQGDFKQLKTTGFQLACNLHPVFILNYQFLMNMKTSKLFPGGSVIISKMGDSSLAYEDKMGNKAGEVFVPAMQVSHCHQSTSLRQIKTGRCKETCGLNHMMPGLLILTVSHIMNCDTNAHCQNDQGQKGDEANNPGLRAGSFPGLHYSWPKKERGGCYQRAHCTFTLAQQVFLGIKDRVRNVWSSHPIPAAETSSGFDRLSLGK